MIAIRQALARPDRDLVERDDGRPGRGRRAARRTRSASSPAQPQSGRARLQVDRVLEEAHARRRRAPPLGRTARHSASRVVAHVRRVAELLRLLDVLTHEHGVDDEARSSAATRAISRTAWRDVGEVVRRDAAGDDVEARSRRTGGPRRGRSTSGLHPRRGVAGDDVDPRPRAAGAPRGRRRSRRRAPCARPAAHSTSRSRSSPSRCASRRRRTAAARSTRRSRHAASSTARFAASSIVGCDVQVRRRGLGEDPAALVGVRAVEAHDDRQLEGHLAERLQDPARDLVAARDTAEDVEEDRLHLRVAA